MAKVKKNKMKTHKASSKVFKKKKNGDLTYIHSSSILCLLVSF